MKPLTVIEIFLEKVRDYYYYENNLGIIYYSLSKRTKNQDTINKRAAMLKRSYDLVGALIQIQQILHSLRVKINVAQ